MDELNSRIVRLEHQLRTWRRIASIGLMTGVAAVIGTAAAALREPSEIRLTHGDQTTLLGAGYVAIESGTNRARLTVDERSLKGPKSNIQFDRKSGLAFQTEEGGASLGSISSHKGSPGFQVKYTNLNKGTQRLLFVDLLDPPDVLLSRTGPDQQSSHAWIGISEAGEPKVILEGGKERRTISSDDEVAPPPATVGSDSASTPICFGLAWERERPPRLATLPLWPMRRTRGSGYGALM